MSGPRAVFLLCLLCVFAAAVVGRSDAARSRGATIATLRLGTIDPVISLNPAFNTSVQGCGAEYCALLIEHLTQFTPIGTVKPDLATSLTQAGRTVYVAHLRHGVRFWDGNELTSADVVNSLDYERKPDTNTFVFLTSVRSVTARDRYTVVITLKHPDATLAQNLAFAGGIFEQAFQDAHKATFGKPGTLIQATGPYQVDSFNPTSGLELSPNPHWWGGAIPVRHISVKVLKDETGEALAMRAGELDIAFPAIGGPFAKTAGSSVRVLSVGTSTVAYFGMNVRQAPWNDVHVRRAVAYALNRPQLVVANGGKGSATPESYFIPEFELENLVGHAKVKTLLRSIPTYPYNIAKAKQELARSAYPHGFTASTDTVSIVNYDVVNEAISAELAKIGIKLKVRIVDYGTWSNELTAEHGRTAGDIYTYIGAQNADPGNLPGQMLGAKNAGPGGLNFANYTAPGLDDLLKEGVETTAPSKRVAVYVKLMKLLAADEPYVPLYRQNQSLALGPHLALPGFGQFEFFTKWAVHVKST
jgi:peptide/nickel transport system substrate-binding protein